MATTLLDYFGTALVINLVDRADRRRSIEEEFKRLGWSNYQFFSAKRFDDPAGFKTAGWRGCFNSHLECLRLAQKEQRERVLILEDDLTVSPSITRLTPELLNTIQKLNWDFIYFGHEMTGEIARARSGTSGVSFKRHADGDIFTAHFYAVRKRIIPALIAHLERNEKTVPPNQYYGPMPVDGAYNTFRRYNKDVVTYIADPKLGWQRPSRSDLTPRLVDDVKMLRPLISLGRSFKDFLGRKLR